MSDAGRPKFVRISDMEKFNAYIVEVLKGRLSKSLLGIVRSHL